MTEPARQARLIAIDGIDGVGKSTQIQRLTDYVRAAGLQAETVQDPGGTPVGARLRELLLDSDLDLHRRTEAMLFMASRCELIEKKIRPALERGTIVITDRFLLSNVVYQSVGGSVSPEQLWQMGRWANDGLRPDLTILLDMPAATAIERLGRPHDRMEQRGTAYLEQVRQAFLRELAQASDRTRVIDATQTVDQVADQIRTAVKHELVVGQS